MPRKSAEAWTPSGRRYFIGGSDARIIMGDDEAALLRLWRGKRGEVEPGGPSRQPHRPARGRHRTPQPRHDSNATPAGPQRGSVAP